MAAAKGKSTEGSMGHPSIAHSGHHRMQIASNPCNNLLEESLLVKPSYSYFSVAV